MVTFGEKNKRKRKTKRNKRKTKSNKQKRKTKTKTKTNSNKQKRKTKTNSNKQSGGFYRELDIDHIRNWNNIHRESMDCCPCVFNLLGLDLDESNWLIDTYGKTGMKHTEILTNFSNMFPEYSFSFLNTYDSLHRILLNGEKIKTDGSLTSEDKLIMYEPLFNQYQEVLSDFFKDVPNNHGVVALIHFKDKQISHCVVFAKRSGQLELYDGQNEISFAGLYNVASYLIRQKVEHIQYLMGIGKATEYDITGPWRDAKFSKNEVWDKSNKERSRNLERPSKFYPSLFDYPSDGVYSDRTFPNVPNDDVFYDSIEQPDVFYDVEEGY
jgi:hypothetical protein